MASDEEMVTVWLEEEYGYRYWRWDTGMSHEDLVLWWSSMGTIRPYFFSPNGLPGSLTELDSDEWDEGTRDMPETVPADFNPEEFVPEDPEWARANARWLCATPKTGIYKAHIHEDEDSCLKLPDNTFVHHKGFKSYED